jgi:predicted CXXCH cytochrome family protein
MTLPSGEILPLHLDEEAFGRSVHGGILECQTCHAGYGVFPHPTLQAGNSFQYRMALKRSCQSCHTEAYAQMESSVHSRLDGKGITCADCHGAHKIDAAETASLRTASLALCTGCHQDRQLMEPYGISTNVVSTYLKDFHGRSSLLQTKQGQAWIDPAVCSDCHGAHSVLRVNSPGSQVVKNNLTATCQKCHEAATPNFPDSWLSHYEPGPTKAPMVFLARVFYWVMIPFTIGGLLIHIVIDLRHQARLERVREE